MFPANTYSDRRSRLNQKMNGGGLIFLMGNVESGMNYGANVYPFRQDSTFLYFFGIDSPGLAAIIDLDEGTTIIYGEEITMDDVVWTGPQPTLRDKAQLSGVDQIGDVAKLAEILKAASNSGKKVNFLPPYRPENQLKIGHLLGMHPEKVNSEASVELIRAVVALRSIKSEEEIREIEAAVNLTGQMHTKAMQMARPGMTEAAIVGALQEIVHSAESRTSFPIILSKDGEILHNHGHHNTLEAGQMVLCDCGAESAMHYAGDMTRTFPVSSVYSSRQREVYQICLDSQVGAIQALQPGTTYKDVHLVSARIIAEGMKSLGLMKGNMEEAVSQGAHALFFQHGLGHMMGLDVHDMEDLGEQYVGYTDTLTKSKQFGLGFLRLGRELEPGFVLTVEPGIYFIPQLIDMWKAENKFSEFINYENVEAFKSFGGIRIEEDFLITTDGARLLGNPVAKTVEDVEMVRRS